ncbi:MAG: hypothetical protein GWN97_20460, partial [Thermoplasmata archaeon]|nr:hypothetical protein [Thermoplasmata archaeon]NIS14211.1 hypothetical protein [Thermoplasmata archaeon]
MGAQELVPEEQVEEGPGGPAGGRGPLVITITAALVTVAVIFAAVTLFQAVKEPEDERT